MTPNATEAGVPPRHAPRPPQPHIPNPTQGPFTGMLPGSGGSMVGGASMALSQHGNPV